MQPILPPDIAAAELPASGRACELLATDGPHDAVARKSIVGERVDETPSSVYKSA
jgi:hypothetical protein